LDVLKGHLLGKRQVHHWSKLLVAVSLHTDIIHNGDHAQLSYISSSAHRLLSTQH